MLWVWEPQRPRQLWSPLPGLWAGGWQAAQVIPGTENQKIYTPNAKASMQLVPNYKYLAYAVLKIRIGFNADTDPAFEFLGQCGSGSRL